MHFDDRLATVLNMPVTGREMARIQFRQLIDILDHHRGAADQAGSEHESGEPAGIIAAYARLEALAGQIPVAERAAILREPLLRLGNPELVGYLAAQEPDVAAAAMTSAELTQDAWLALIPQLPIRARGILRHRRDFSPAIAALLDRLGIADRGLETPAEPTAERTRPELVVVPGGMAAPPEPPQEEQQSAGIGAIVRRIEEFRKARAGDAEPGGPEQTVAHVKAAAHAILLAVDFTTGGSGRVDWADGRAASSLIGTNLADFTAIADLMRQRQPIRAAHVTLPGAPELAGSWRLDALPCFDEDAGRFVGYAGRLRRSGKSVGEGGSNAADSMRQVLHELRTPANAIQIAAEIIQQQLYGAAPHEYRALAAAIAGDTAQILAGFDELDRLVKLESGALAPSPGECDLGRIVVETVSRLRAWTTPRGSGFSLAEPAPWRPVGLDHEEIARLVWRLLAGLAGASAPGETLLLGFPDQGGAAVLTIDLPTSLAERLDNPSPVMAIEPAGSLSSGMFGLGFTLRLAVAEAAAAGGVLKREGARFRLCLPGLTPAITGHTQA